MSIPTNKPIKAVRYNGTNIPLSGSQAMQTKTVTYTSNGTELVTPDAGYAGLSSVSVTVAIPVYDGSVTG